MKEDKGNEVRGIAFILALFSILFFSFYFQIVEHLPAWTGFGPYDEAMQGPRGKTLWDLLELIVVPVVIAIAVWWLNDRQKAREIKAADERNEREQILIDERLNQERLEIYFDWVRDLILNRGPLVGYQSIEASLLRARTAAILTNMDSRRNGQVVRFLAEARLVNDYKNVDSSNHQPLISLSACDLHEADLSSTFLAGADLSRANLDSADLSLSELSRAYCDHANMANTRLFAARGLDSYFRGVDFSNANLSMCQMRDALLSGAIMRSANLTGADLHSADLSWADLIGANLSNANLEDCDMRQANLRNAYLINTNLMGVRFDGADFTGVIYNNMTAWPNNFDPQAAGAIHDEAFDRSQD